MKMAVFSRTYFASSCTTEAEPADRRKKLLADGLRKGWLLAGATQGGREFTKIRLDRSPGS